MGILYKEIVQHKRKKAISLILLLALMVITMDTIFLLSSYRQIIDELAYICYGVIPVALIGTVYVWQKLRRYYRYTIIDKEIIIEKFIGEKRKPILSFNAKNIIKIEKVVRGTKYEKVDKEYYFTCSGKKKNVYICTFAKDNTLCRIYFEPSTELISKLGILSNKKYVA